MLFLDLIFTLEPPSSIAVIYQAATKSPAIFYVPGLFEPFHGTLTRILSL